MTDNAQDDQELAWLRAYFSAERTRLACWFRRRAETNFRQSEPSDLVRH